MSVCAVMLVRDEVDIIETTIRHLLAQVDYVMVADNMSQDGTTEILRELETEHDDQLEVFRDEEVAYYQAVKTTNMAHQATARGFDWVLPCDADEIWYANGRRVSELLDGVAPDIVVVEARLFNHIPSAQDPPQWETVVTSDNVMRKREVGPIARIGWRQREHQQLPKVAARCRPDLQILAGNHGARTSGTGRHGDGLIIRHFSWRTADQYLRKIRNGVEAYAATNLDEETGLHWRMWADRSDDDIREHFRTWFWSADPESDHTLIYDPAPVSR